MPSMPHLLIVDDDEDILSLLMSVFQKHSHVVSVAEDGDGMFAESANNPIDLVTLETSGDRCRRVHMHHGQAEWVKQGSRLQRQG
jgi:DNA-binding response OmpR family regulator